MPSQVAITVKKADGTTDIVYDALSSSGGDGSPAVYRQDTGAPAGLPVGLRPVLKLTTTSNGPKTARQMRINYASPYAVQDSTTTLYSAKDRVVVDAIITVPQGMPSAAINEAVYQFCNLVASNQVKQAASSGYAPT